MQNPAFESLPSLSVWALALAALATSGCPDPEGSFNDFGARYDAINNSSDGGSGTGGAPDCAAVTAGDNDGQYLFALSAVLSPKKAFALDTSMTVTSDGADGFLVDLNMQPLSKMDQMTPAGDPLVFTGLAVAADGTFTWDFGTVTLAGTANPISDLDIITTLVLTGQLCGGSDFICGDVTGTVATPIPDYDLTGSTFTMQRYEGTKPAPVINCAKDPAKY
ncbi:MAG: hypothetical protein U0271_35105 [Polyangiaceae bacterium]